MSVANPCVFALVGNKVQFVILFFFFFLFFKFFVIFFKVDCEENRQVSFDEAFEYADSMNASFFECSASKNISIEKIFMETCEKVFAQPSRMPGTTITGTGGPPQRQEETCGC